MGMGPPLQRQWYIPGDREPVESREEGFEGGEERPVGQQADTLAHVQHLLEGRGGEGRGGEGELSSDIDTVLFNTPRYTHLFSHTQRVSHLRSTVFFRNLFIEHDHSPVHLEGGVWQRGMREGGREGGREGARDSHTVLERW